MNETRNLCAQIPIALHDRVHEEKTRTGKTLCAHKSEKVPHSWDCVDTPLSKG